MKVKRTILVSLLASLLLAQVPAMKDIGEKEPEAPYMTELHKRDAVVKAAAYRLLTPEEFTYILDLGATVYVAPWCIPVQGCTTVADQKLNQDMFLSLMLQQIKIRLAIEAAACPGGAK